MQQRHSLLRRSIATLAGLMSGALTAVVELLFVVLSALALVPVVATPRARRSLEASIHRCARQLAAMEQRRLATFHNLRDLGPYSDRSAYDYILRRWAPGGLLKDRVMRVEDFLEALERVGSGGVALDPEVVRQLLSRTTHTDPLQKLTVREREVLAVMAEGHNNTGIAQRLFISSSAVEKHSNAIFDN